MSIIREATPTERHYRLAEKNNLNINILGNFGDHYTCFSGKDPIRQRY